MSLQNDYYGMPSYGMPGTMNSGINSGMSGMGGMGGGYGREEYGMPSYGMAGGMGGMSGMNNINGMRDFPRGGFSGRGSMSMGSMRGYIPDQDSGMNSGMGSRRPNGGSSMQSGYGRSVQGGYGRSMQDGFERTSMPGSSGGYGVSMPGGGFARSMQEGNNYGPSMQGGSNYGPSMQGSSNYGRSMQGGYGRSQSMTSRGYGRDEPYGGRSSGYHHAMGGPRDFQDDMRFGGGMPQDRMGGDYRREGFSGSNRDRFNGQSVAEQGFSGSDYRSQQTGRTNNGYNQRSMRSNWN